MNYEATNPQSDSPSNTFHSEGPKLMMNSKAPVPSFYSSPSISSVTTAASTHDLSESYSGIGPTYSLKSELGKAESGIGKTVSVGRKRDVKKQAKEDLFASMSQEDRASYTCYIDQCEECKSKDLVTKQREGTIVCQSCGLVQQSRIIDETSEWRTFSTETSNSGGNPSRVGGRLNPYLSNYGIDT